MELQSVGGGGNSWQIEGTEDFDPAFVNKMQRLFKLSHEGWDLGAFFGIWGDCGQMFEERKGNYIAYMEGVFPQRVMEAVQKYTPAREETLEQLQVMAEGVELSSSESESEAEEPVIIGLIRMVALPGEEGGEGRLTSGQFLTKFMSAERGQIEEAAKQCGEVTGLEGDEEERRQRLHTCLRIAIFRPHEQLSEGFVELVSGAFTQERDEGEELNYVTDRFLLNWINAGDNKEARLARLLDNDPLFNGVGEDLRAAITSWCFE